MKAFHAYDIRGIYNVDFNKEDVFKIGYYLPQLLKAKKVLVGRDVRVSSPEIYDFLCKGIILSGSDVYNIGLATTPMIYWTTARYGFDASVMITASHNSKEYNGLKVSKTDALPVGYDNGLNLLEEYVKSDKELIQIGLPGKIIEQNFKNEYLDFQRQYLKDISGLKIAIDCSNGMAGLLIRDLLNDKPVYINETLDGSFPNHEPNPLVEKNVQQLKNIVKENHCDIGIIFDGDADRVMFVDEHSNFISPDLIIAVLAHYFLEEKGLHGSVLQDIRTSKSVQEYIKKFGSNVFTWRVGRAYAALKLREINGIFGGELAGHYYFKDFYYSDSGILACLIVLGVVSKLKSDGKGFSTLISQISQYANSGEINFKIENKKLAMDKVRNHFVSIEKPIADFDFDGYRVEYEDWWFNIRPSNTEPYLRLLVEAKNKELLKQKVDEISTIINSYI